MWIFHSFYQHQTLSFSFSLSIKLRNKHSTPYVYSKRIWHHLQFILYMCVYTHIFTYGNIFFRVTATINFIGINHLIFKIMLLKLMGIFETIILGWCIKMVTCTTRRYSNQCVCIFTVFFMCLSPACNIPQSLSSVAALTGFLSRTWNNASPSTGTLMTWPAVCLPTFQLPAPSSHTGPFGPGIPSLSSLLGRLLA